MRVRRNDFKHYGQIMVFWSIFHMTEPVPIRTHPNDDTLTPYVVVVVLCK